MGGTAVNVPALFRISSKSSGLTGREIPATGEAADEMAESG